MELHETIFAAGMTALLVGYALFLGLKYRGGAKSKATVRAPLLSWGLSISLLLFVVFVVSFSIFIFTVTRSPDDLHSFEIEMRGGTSLYTHPFLGRVWISSLVASGGLGVLNLLSYVWYSRNGKIKVIRLPGLGKLDLEE